MPVFQMLKIMVVHLCVLTSNRSFLSLRLAFGSLDTFIQRKTLTDCEYGD